MFETVKECFIQGQSQRPGHCVLHMHALALLRRCLIFQCKSVHQNASDMESDALFKGVLLSLVVTSSSDDNASCFLA